MLTTIRAHLIELENHYGSLRKVAKARGIDQAYLYRLKTGEKSNPRPETLDKLGLCCKTILYEQLPHA